jgi:hypothetical protein
VPSAIVNGGCTWSCRYLSRTVSGVEDVTWSAGDEFDGKEVAFQVSA